MMKMTYRAISVCVLLAACSPADDVSFRPLEVSAEIASGLTRATVDGTNYDKAVFDLDDEIQVGVKGSGTATKYKKRESGWLPADGSEGLNTTGNQTYTATYPATFSNIQENQTTYSGFWSSNQLRSEAKAIANRVTFGFSPMAAKITIVVVYDASKTPSGTNVTGMGIRTNSATTEKINLLLTSGNAQLRHSYVGIIYPVVGKTYTISVTNSGESAQTYAQPSITLMAGHNYQYNFSSSNELILTGVTVKPFNDQTEEDAGSAT